MKTRSSIGMVASSFVMMASLAACNSVPHGPANAMEVEAAVQRAEEELARAEAEGPPAPKTSEAYASLPY